MTTTNIVSLVFGGIGLLFLILSATRTNPVQSKAWLPYGPRNPAIFFNAACAFFELGELDKVFENIKLAIDYGFEPVEMMRTEPLFRPISNDPRFTELFAKLKIV